MVKLFMRTLLICGYFEKEYQTEILSKTKSFINSAANIFQERLIEGLVKTFDLTIFSAPFIAPYPNGYKDIYFRHFQHQKQNSFVRYIPFNNLWGYRNLSRTRNLKREIGNFMRAYPSEKKSIIVYSVHTPFLEAAVYAKQLAPDTHICMVAPDLPQYMNLDKKNRMFYDFFKQFDIRRFYQLNAQVNSYVLLTKDMADVLETGKRPYIVVEGIASPSVCPIRAASSGKKIAYAGKLVESFGVKKLLDAFSQLTDTDATLEICGNGELKEYLLTQAKKDKRIYYHGTVSAQKAHEILQQADILVNPRQNNEVYTHYSFPSKNIEYLQTGNKVIAYMLAGIPEVYRDFFVVPVDNSVAGLCAAIRHCFEMSATEQENKYYAFQNYIKNLLPLEVACKIRRLIDG